MVKFYNNKEKMIIGNRFSGERKKVILALFLETRQKRPRKGEVRKQKQSTFWMKTNQMFDSVAVITSEKNFLMKL